MRVVFQSHKSNDYVDVVFILYRRLIEFLKNIFFKFIVALKFVAFYLHLLNSNYHQQIRFKYSQNIFDVNQHKINKRFVVEKKHFERENFRNFRVSMINQI